MYRLFVFEGDPQTTEALQAQLAQRMIATQASASVQQAQQILAQTPPHIVLFDLTHPLHEVETLYRWITTHPQLHAVPRVFLSLPHQEQLLVQLRQEGETHIFERPLRPSLFFDTLQKLLPHNPDPFVVMPKKKKLEDAISAMVGRKIGSFLLEKEIGRGGMGAVFRAHQEALQRKVALKIMLPNAQQDETCIRRFQREALAIAQLKSPHIVQVFDAGTTEDDIFYIAMEFLEGENIDQFLRTHKRIPELQAVAVIEQVALGLKVAHDAGLIHRDIKPSNLIIDPRGQVTLTDFGLVRGNQDMSYTQPGIVVGSPHYLSPEQASGKPLDHRSDIYALGIVFFEILTGTAPFRGSNISNVMLKHIQEPLPDPREHTPDISPGTIHILQKMTQKEPAARYQDCSALLESIRALKHSIHPVSAGSWPGIATSPPIPLSPSPNLSPAHPPHAFGQTQPPHPSHAFGQTNPPHPSHAFAQTQPPLPQPSFGQTQQPLSPPSLGYVQPPNVGFQQHSLSHAPSALPHAPSVLSHAPSALSHAPSALSPSLPHLQAPLQSTPLKGSLSLSPDYPPKPTPQARLLLSPNKHILQQQGAWNDLTLQSLQRLLGSERMLALPSFGAWLATQLESATLQLSYQSTPQGYEATLLPPHHDQHSMNMMRQSMASPAPQQTLDAFFAQLFSSFGVVGALLVGKQNTSMKGQTADPTLYPALQQQLPHINQICFSLPIDLVGLEWSFQYIHVLFWRFPSFGLFVLTQHNAHKSTLAALLQQYRPLLQHAESSFTGSSFSSDSGAGTMSPLVEQAAILSEATFEAIQLELTRIVGPMAQIALKQAIKKLGHTRQQFPQHDGPKLLETLAQRLDSTKQEAFLRAATPHISSKRSP